MLLLGAIAIDTRGFAPSLLGTKYNGRDLTLTLTLALTPTLTLTRYNGRDLAAGRKLLAVRLGLGLGSGPGSGSGLLLYTAYYRAGSRRRASAGEPRPRGGARRRGDDARPLTLTLT